jgi:2,4-dienoyl-CoA reductase-like NADH-dependent reductase (Old Yellow Enzyme family)
MRAAARPRMYAVLLTVRPGVRQGPGPRFQPLRDVFMSSALFSPIRLAGLELSNRIVVAPMCQYSATNGEASDWHMTHLGMLANSGAAMVVVEMTDVEPEGRITAGCLGLFSDTCEAALTRVIAHCKRIGSACFGVQIAHAGRKASALPPWKGGKPVTPSDGGWEGIAPSAIPFGKDWPVPREMTEADMTQVRDGFVSSTQRALRCGFDAIELHIAHGYLLHSFISPLSNRRKDSYGGTLDGRMRFPLEVVRAVRAVMPKDVPLGARITGSDWLDGGITPEDAVAYAGMLKEAGLDFVDVSSGGLTQDARNPTGYCYNAPLAEAVRRGAGLATRAVGLIVTPQQAEAVVAGGQADMVTLGRAVLDDPHWGWHAAQALGGDVTRPPQYLRAGPALWPGAALRA